jgi:hypothetical protein
MPSVRDAALRATIRSRPAVQQLAGRADQWASMSDLALARGELGLASFYQERAAILEHRLGLLEDEFIGIVTNGAGSPQSNT